MALIATKLLRDEFFTIFGDLDTKTVQQGRGFEAKVFRQVCQMLVNAIGGTSILCMVERGSLAGVERRH